MVRIRFAVKRLNANLSVTINQWAKCGWFKINMPTFNQRNA